MIAIRGGVVAAPRRMGPVSVPATTQSVANTCYSCLRISRQHHSSLPFPAARPSHQPCVPLPQRHFSQSSSISSSSSNQNQKGDKSKDGRIQWYWIPTGLGIAFLGLMQVYKISIREQRKELEELGDKPNKRPRIKPQGPWQVQIMSTLPLKAISRLWGWFNEITIPYYLRIPGFKLYSFLFGVNLAEVAETDLHKFKNLADFFYRELKPGVRPIDPNHDSLISPADGRVLQFGRIEGGEVEQVKGMTYHVDALLGSQSSTPSSSRRNSIASSVSSSGPPDEGDEHLEFARMNGISYTLPELMSGQNPNAQQKNVVPDESMPASPGAEKEVEANLAQAEKPWYALFTPDHHTSLYYVVVYLAPGDYHRFHSPTAWVAESRRHFAGELYSVSPYLVKMLPGLFTLNERVVLLGRWRYGFFSFVPVGATNVGSIRINFDRELRTNSLLTDTAADRAAEAASKRGEPYTGFSEASYEAASPVLGGHALKRGEEMGGFRLGSTVVLVFEAPAGGKHERGWEWAVEKGQKVRMGQALGYVVDGQ
ncbi:hypothetical protein MKZ38_000719 [Zalerion maritima]|uniref:Phosphatidylserine decarboxylase proenzyme 1, mitochondrial n=1 Tax=Zalerion maritima TaxID=339359 RepID=A0AAD5RZ33_9PEZI|nr:hypothetical protein MKZ38_000719 [Zalerion maritima]